MSTEACPQPPGAFAPQIDRNRCEGKEDCVGTCPYRVFEMRVLTEEERRELSFLGRWKAAVHGNRQAFAIHPEACRACGDCVKACPERAITLMRMEVEKTV